MVGGGHNLVLSLGLGDGNARTCWLKRGCPKKDRKNNNKIMRMEYLNRRGHKRESKLKWV